jgi:hypothetical protein
VAEAILIGGLWIFALQERSINRNEELEKQVIKKTNGYGPIRNSLLAQIFLSVFLCFVQWRSCVGHIWQALDVFSLLFETMGERS